MSAVEDAPLRVFFLDVGQGDACLLRTPGNRWFLFDSGNQAETLLPFLRSAGVDTLEAAFVSHPDLDHFGAFPEVLRAFPVKKVYLPSESNANPAWLELLARLDAFTGEKDTLFAGDTLLWEGGVRARALWPFPHSGFLGNDISTVLRIEYLSLRILLTGDIEDGAERELLATGADLGADILKVAHHGSRTSSGLPFIAAVSPRWAVISCDSAAYGHPHAETIADLELFLGREGRILRTDRDGTIGFELDKWGVRRIL
ncbi:MAG: ComEC/Rec2 family competence protein [Fibrobacteria bacterium]